MKAAIEPAGAPTAIDPQHEPELGAAERGRGRPREPEVNQRILDGA